MEIVRILNNNVVEACREGKEVVVMGKGLAFGCKTGGKVPEEKIEKIFELSSAVIPPHLQKMIEEIPFEYWDFVTKVEQIVNSSLNITVSSGFYTAMIDHIYIAVKRVREKMAMPIFTMNELSYMYQKEITLAKEIAALAEQEFNVEFDASESYFIAIHIIDSQYESNSEVLSQITNMLKKILAIVEKHFPNEIYYGTLSYSRFLTHLRLFLERLILRRECVPPIDGMDSIYEDFQLRYPKHYRCEKKIQEFILREMDYMLSVDEEFYILLHLIKVSIND